MTRAEHTPGKDEGSKADGGVRFPKALNHAYRQGFEVRNQGKGCFCGLFWFLNEKNRIKCGYGAIFPQRTWYKMAPIAGKSEFHNEEDSWHQA